jgi:IS5 family transposase
MRQVADRLSVRWYLGYDLDEPLPDHSSLSKIRLRYGTDVFRQFFETVVELCQQAKLVWGKELYIDSTQVNANADLDSLAPRFAIEAREAIQQHLKALFPDQVEQQESAEGITEEGSDPEPLRESITCQPPISLPVVLDDVLREELSEENAARHDWIAEEGRQQREVHGSYQRTADFRISTTDPDATAMRLKGGGTHLGYHTHYVVDGGKSRIILAALVTPSEVTDNQPMLDLIWRTRFRWHIWPKQVTGDSAYGTAENITAIEYANIRAYIPIAERGHHTGFYGQAQFTYDPVKDQYRCPEGQVLSPIYQSPQTQEVRYRAEAAICNICPVKAQCTSSQSGRSVSRSSSVDEMERVKAYEQTLSYQKALRKRQVWVEPLFGEGKQWHGMSRFRLRRLWRVNCEALMTATGQNLKRLLRKRGWGRRPFPTEAVVALPPPDRKTDEFLKQDSEDFYRPSIAASAFDLSNALNPFLVTQISSFCWIITVLSKLTIL